MRKHFEQMEQLFEERLKDIDFEEQEVIDVAINDQPQSQRVVLTLANIGAEDIGTHLNAKGNKLTLKSNTLNAVIRTKRDYISASVQQIDTKVYNAGDISKEKEADDNDRSQEVASSYYSTFLSETVSQKCDLRNAIIEYSKANKTLTISIPYRQADERGIAVPINVK